MGTTTTVEQATIRQYCKALRTPTIGLQFQSLHLDVRLRRHCRLFTIDVEIPKLDVAGSIPVSRSLVSIV